MTARVRVPASSSNLGAGFDCIGVAVDRWLAASVTVDKKGGGFSIRRRGKLSAVKVRPDQDLFTRGFRAACAAGGGVTPVGVTIDATSDIPVGCGLGSSAAAIVAGAMLADAALGLGLSRAQVLEIGTTIEGHPDNIAPAIYGGAVLSVRTPAGLVSTSLSVADGLALLLVVPPFPSDTKAARAVLPRTLPHSDAVSAASRAAALVQGLSSGDGARRRAACAVSPRAHSRLRCRRHGGARRRSVRGDAVRCRLGDRGDRAARAVGCRRYRYACRVARNGH